MLASNEVTLSAGQNTAYLLTTRADENTLRLYNATTDVTNYSLSGAIARIWSGPYPKEFTTDYVIHNGSALSSLIPLGLHYLKLIDQDAVEYVSDWFESSNINKNLISKWINIGANPYETFLSSSTSIYANNTTGYGQCSSDSFRVDKSDKIIVIFYMSIATGTAPNVYLSQAGVGGVISNSVQSNIGLNVIELTATKNQNAALNIQTTSTVDFSTGPVYVIRSYSHEYTRIEFSNTKDLQTPIYEPTIYYQNWKDVVYLKGRLAPPTHEISEVGEEKDGNFIAEKIVAKFMHRMVTFVNRTVYRALHRLKLHDDVKVYDTQGNEYDVDHNIDVETLEANTFDTGTLRTSFNTEGSVWSENANNLS